VGATREFTADVRVVAATNRGLEDEVAQGRFRADLMYRLRILQVRLPPLRERERDAECLARHFAAMYAKKYRVPLRRFSDEALAWMARHPWPGNVREIENWVHRSMILGDGDTIDAAAPPTLAAPPGHADQLLALPGFRDAKLAAIERFERDYLEAALRRTGGNLTQAARLAGKERRDFSRLVKKHGIGREV
jgi:DNA-binding NtrC family response regulator